MAAGRCRGCAHAVHKDGCRAKGTQRCVTMLNPETGEQSGTLCARTRFPCPCPWGRCHTCGAEIAGAQPLPLGVLEVDVDCGSAGDPDGTLAVRQLIDGSLCARQLADGQDPGEREWRGRAHTHQLPEAAVWLARQPEVA